MASLNRWTDQRVEQIVGNLLRAGVLSAAGIVLVGAVLYLRQHGATIPDYEKFKGEPPALRRFTDVVADAMTLDGLSVIQLGLLVLLATPVARVAFSVIAFVLLRDRLYVLITLVVLAVLLFSLWGFRL